MQVRILPGVLNWAVHEVHEIFMREALREAQEALDRDEVPVGAVLVCNDEIIARGRNRTRERSDPTAHAEMEAIRMASAEAGDWRLTESTLYVTLEPCVMCAGAIMTARIPRLVFGSSETRWDQNMTQLLLCEGRFNHTVEVISGVLEEDSRKLLDRFFGKLRLKRK